MLAYRHYHSTRLHIQRDAIPENSVYRRRFSIMPSAAEKRKSSTSTGIVSIGSNVLLAVFAVLLFIAQLINGQQNGQQQTCPAVHEISPCLCQVKKNGLDILCEATDYTHITRAMTALKPKSPIIFYLKLRHNSLPKLQGFIFLALDIRHLTIHNSSLAVIEETSLSSLGKFSIHLTLLIRVKKACWLRPHVFYLKKHLKDIYQKKKNRESLSLNRQRSSTKSLNW